MYCLEIMPFVLIKEFIEKRRLSSSEYNDLCNVGSSQIEDHESDSDPDELIEEQTIGSIFKVLAREKRQFGDVSSLDRFPEAIVTLIAIYTEEQGTRENLSTWRPFV